MSQWWRAVDNTVPPDLTGPKFDPQISRSSDKRFSARPIEICFPQGVEIFTFGVHSGNVEELTAMASDPKEDHVYILKSFAEFESVARRALHAGKSVFSIGILLKKKHLKKNSGELL